MLEIDGDDSSTTTADVTELQLLIEGAAAVEVDINISDERSVERSRCCGGRGVPRRPASGRAGPQALADLSRGMAVAACGICWKPFRQPESGRHEGPGRLWVQHACLHGN